MNVRHAGLVAGVSAMMATGALAEEQRFDFEGFTSVDLSAGIELVVRTGPDFSVLAESPRRGGLRRLEIEQKGSSLRISRETSWSGLSLLRSAPEITVTITMPELRELSASSGSSASVEGVRVDRFESHASSGAAVAIKDMIATEVEIHGSSGAAFSASGTCEALDIQASSGAALNVSALECDHVEADASSGANLSVYARDRADAEASSGAMVSVGGDPDFRDERESSGGSVVFR